MKILIAPILLILISFLTACPKGDEDLRIQFNNESNQNVYLHYNLSSDTILPLSKENNLGEIIFKASSEKKSNRYIYLPANRYDSLSVFILDVDTVDKYGWHIIQEQYKILKRYDIDINKDLKRMNWTITYP